MLRLISVDFRFKASKVASLRIVFFTCKWHSPKGNLNLRTTGDINVKLKHGDTLKESH